MIKEQVTLDETIDFLNELIKIDAPAIAALIANRVPCNKQLADHPTVQCLAQHGGFSVGMLGIINGLFGAHEGEYRHGWGPIMFILEDGNVERVNFTEEQDARSGTDQR